MKSSKRQCIIAVAIFFSLIASNNVLAVDYLEYFPHEVGTFWEYMVKVDEPNSTDKYITRQYYTFVSEEYVNGKKYSRMDNKKVDLMVISPDFFDYTRYSDDGVYRILADNTEVLKIKFPLIVGSEWETRNFAGAGQVYKVEGIETVEIAGYRFNECIKLCLTWKDEKSKNTKTYYYYAPKFGLVREVYIGENGYRNEKTLIRTNIDDKNLEFPLRKYFQTNAPNVSMDKVTSAIETQISKTFPFVFSVTMGKQSVMGPFGAQIINEDEKMLGKENLKYSENMLSPTYYNFLKACQSIGLIKIEKINLTDVEKVANMGGEKIIIGVTPKTNDAFISTGRKEKESQKYKFKSGELRVKKIVKNIKERESGDGYEYRKVLGIFEVHNTLLGTELFNSMKPKPPTEYKFNADIKLDPFNEKYIVTGISWANMDEDDWKSFARFYEKGKR